ncbi:MAG: FIVAR domain-containing protein [Lachnospiraceae bacterium]|nr:FIVAR domain-containing protein [Lachnospiraceae bacterium]
MKTKQWLKSIFATVMIFAMTLSFLPVNALAEETEVTSDAEVITIQASDVEAAATNQNGLTYKGFGMLNHSTGNLLFDYKTSAPEKYEEMMSYLFGGENPLFTHIKIEMGNDGNNAASAEACTMRYEDEEADASRSVGFVMAADAKAINSNVKVSILRWAMPDWVKTKWNSDRTGEGYEAVYKWYRETIFDAYEKYGYVIDFVNPDENEAVDPDEDFIKWFANKLATEIDFPEYFSEDAKDAYNNIRIIAADEKNTLNIVSSMRNDSELYDAADVIGLHYRTSATEDYVTMADVDDKEVWYSEGCAAFGYTELQENKTSTYGYKSIGGYQSPLALMDSIITGASSARHTHYIFQPAIGSFYEGLSFGHKELLSACDPWSGYIHYDPALYMLEHFAKFAKTGWEDSNPEQNDIWRVIAGATDGSFDGSEDEHETAGIDGDAGYMTLASPDGKDFSVVFVNNTQNTKYFCIKEDGLDIAEDAALNFWLTETDNYMQNKGTIEKGTDGWLVMLPPYSMATATTLIVDETELALPEEGMHNDDRTVLDTDEAGVVNGVTEDTILYADDFEYEEYDENYMVSRGNEPRYMSDAHGAWVVENGMLKQELSTAVKQWNDGEPSTVIGDSRWMDYVASVDVTIPKEDGMARLSIRSQGVMSWNDSGYTFEISDDGNWKLYRLATVVASGKTDMTENHMYSLKLLGYGNKIMAAVNGEKVVTYTDSVPMLSGRVQLSSAWDTVYFDNLKIETVLGGIPYAVALVDSQDDSVEYAGTWSIENPGGRDGESWYRTLSIANTSDASFTFKVHGTGFALVGENANTAVIDVYVDNELKDENAETLAAPIRGESYVFSDLADGEHTITVVVKSGELVVDALYTLGIRKETAEDVVIDASEDSLLEIPAIPVDSTIEEINERYTLPKQVEVTSLTGENVLKDVVWSVPENAYDVDAFGRTNIIGTVQNVVDLFGYPITVSLGVDTVVFNPTYYFIDTVEAEPAENATTEAYEAVKSIYGDMLINEVSDQLKTAENTWGLVDKDCATKSHLNTKDKMATGIYAANNTVGETLSYAFTLPEGSYKIISGHCDWWRIGRSMAVTVSYEGTTIDGGIVNASASANPVIHTTEITLEEETLVTYTLTAMDNNAPIISWLAVCSGCDYKSIKKLTAKLTEVKEMLKVLNEADYTEESWQALQDVITVAEEILKNPELTDTDRVYAVLEEIEKAEESLMTKEEAEEIAAKAENMQALTEILAEADKLVKEDYTEETWEVLQAAIDKAEAVMASEVSVSTDIHAAKENVDAAIKALKTIVQAQKEAAAQKLRTKLAEIKEAVEGMTAEDYTKDSWSAVQNAMIYAENVLKDADVVSSEIVAVCENLEYAWEALEFYVLFDLDFNTDAKDGIFAAGKAKAEVFGDYKLKAKTLADKALYFNGTDTYLEVTAVDGSSLLAGKNAITVSYDVKAESGERNCIFYAAYAGQDQMDNEEYLGIFQDASGLWIECIKNTGGTGQNIYVQADSTDWIHVDILIEKNNITLYVDGEMTESINIVYDLSESIGNTEILRIGKANPEESKGFKGYLDNYMIYNGILSEEEIFANYLESVVNDTSALVAEEYTEESWSILETAVVQAKVILKNEAAAAKDIHLVTESLQNAMDSLLTKAEAKEIAAREECVLELKKVIAKAEILVEEEYTKETWEVLQTAIAKAEKAILKENVSVEKLTEVKVALETALKDLKIVEKVNDDKTPGGDENIKNDSETSKEEEPQETGAVLVTGIKFTEKSLKIAAGKKIALKPVVLPEDADTSELEWSSSKNAYASVNEDGLVATKKAGAGKTITITAKAVDGSGVKATVKIMLMKHAVKKIKLKAANSVRAGKQLKIKTTILTTGRSVNKKLVWTSSNEAWATVKNGVVKTKKAGKGKKVTITAASTDGTNKTAKIKIKIK